MAMGVTKIRQEETGMVSVSYTVQVRGSSIRRVLIGKWKLFERNGKVCTHGSANTGAPYVEGHAVT